MVITMYSKTLLIFLFVCFLSEFSHGQKSKRFFRKDYTYIETSESFYKIHTTPQNWADAKQMCALEGAGLFYPENDDEVHAVMSFWNSTQPALNRAFVGMTDLIAKGIFETIDGKLLSEVFHKWMPGEPNNLRGIEHCVNLYKPGLINDCPCDIKEPFICKKSLQSLDWNYQCNMPNLDGQKSKRFFREDYTYIETSESFYKIHMTAQNWAEAKQMCALEGAGLFYPENDDEVHAVMSFWDSTQPALKSVFVGISDPNAKGIFETINGKLLSEVFHKWMPGEPNNVDGIEHCVHMYNPGLINDCPCDIKLPFICKKSLPVSLDWNCQGNMPNLDYTFNEDTGKCYKLHTTPLNWNEAYNICRVEESSLAVINNVLEANYLANFTKSTVKPRMKWNYHRGIYHVGFHNRFKEGWQTVKGTPMNVDADAWWDNYQPEGDNHEECGSMFYTGRLVNIDCGTKSFFICEHEPALRED